METQIIDEELNQQEDNIPKAGFWIRVVASIVDMFVYAPVIALNFYNLLYLKNLPLQLAITIIGVIYKPLMEYKYGATLGKMAVKVKVVNSSNYGDITFTQAILRYTPWLFNYAISITTTVILFSNPEFQNVTGFMQIGQLQQQNSSSLLSTLSSLVMFGAIIVVPFHKKKQGLHDMLAGTYCIYK